MDFKTVKDNEQMGILKELVSDGTILDLENFLKRNNGIKYTLDDKSGFYGFLVNGHRNRKSPINFLSAKVHLLNNYGYSVNDIDERSKHPPILTATINKYVDLVAALLENGADPDIPNEKGTTALLKAIFDFQGQKELVEIIQLLLKYNAAMNIRNVSGSTAIDKIKLKHDYAQRGLYKPEFDITRYIEELKQYLN